MIKRHRLHCNTKYHPVNVRHRQITNVTDSVTTLATGKLTIENRRALNGQMVRPWWGRNRTALSRRVFLILVSLSHRLFNH